ncbi:MAG: hypothetical protein ACHQ4H_06000 [Ktedonobacterales bacterium]
MSHTLPIPDELYDQIAQYAAEQRQDTDVLGVRLLTEAVRGLAAMPAANNGTQDPFAELAGIISVNDPDAARLHDQYFAGEDVDDAK